MRRMYSKNQIANMATVDGKEINPASVETEYLNTEAFGCNGMIIESSGGDTVIDGQGETNLSGIVEATINSINCGGINCDGANDCFFEGYVEIKYLRAGNPSDDSYVKLNLPTSDPQEAGALWNDNGVVKISNG